MALVVISVWLIFRYVYVYIANYISFALAYTIDLCYEMVINMHIPLLLIDPGHIQV